MLKKRRKIKSCLKRNNFRIAKKRKSTKKRMNTCYSEEQKLPQCRAFVQICHIATCCTISHSPCYIALTQKCCLVPFSVLTRCLRLALANSLWSSKVRKGETKWAEGEIGKLVSHKFRGTWRQAGFHREILFTDRSCCHSGSCLTWFAIWGFVTKEGLHHIICWKWAWSAVKFQWKLLNLQAWTVIVLALCTVWW